MRLSSKSHWDVPIDVDGRIVHILAAHPTPPTFDGPEDRNGMRNADEIGFWADYIAGVDSGWITDDAGVSGGLTADAEFVILGDLNSDPLDGDSLAGAADQVSRSTAQDPQPTSDGAVQAALHPAADQRHATRRPGARHRGLHRRHRRQPARRLRLAVGRLPDRRHRRVLASHERRSGAAGHCRAAGQLRPPTGGSTSADRRRTATSRSLESRRQPNDLGVDGLDIETLDTQVQDRKSPRSEADPQIRAAPPVECTSTR